MHTILECWVRADYYSTQNWVRILRTGKLGPRTGLGMAHSTSGLGASLMAWPALVRALDYIWTPCYMQRIPLFPCELKLQMYILWYILPNVNSHLQHESCINYMVGPLGFVQSKPNLACEMENL